MENKLKLFYFNFVLKILTYQNNWSRDIPLPGNGAFRREYIKPTRLPGLKFSLQLRQDNSTFCQATIIANPF